MRIIELDGKKMDSVMNTHRHLKECMSLPEYYGHNLDAMHDAMSEISENTFVFVENSATMEVSLGEYSQRMEKVWKDLEQENRHICFFLR